MYTRVQKAPLKGAFLFLGQVAHCVLLSKRLPFGVIMEVFLSLTVYESNLLYAEA
jgi:hypothetical protein